VAAAVLLEQQDLQVDPAAAPLVGPVNLAVQELQGKDF
jgi:hypothetical protein